MLEGISEGISGRSRNEAENAQRPRKGFIFIGMV